jgi:hypothetical protein
MQADDAPPEETLAYLEGEGDAFLAKMESATVTAEYFSLLGL